MNLPPPHPIDASRLGLPSASCIERIIHCPGSFLLEKACPEDSSTEWSARGSRIHEANETGDVSALPEDEANLVVRTREAEERIFNQWKDEFQLESVKITREHRVYIYHDGVPIASAQIDFYAVGYDDGKIHALILDLKSGRLEVSPPSSNWQLRTEAVALHRELAAEHIRVAIVQPLRKAEPPCDYTSDTLDASFRLLLHHIKEAQKPDAPLNVGQWCQFCKARFTCPKLQQAGDSLISTKTNGQWDFIRPEDKPEIFKRARIVAKACKDLIERIEDEVDAGLIPGLMRGPGSNVRTISDPIGLYAKLLQDFGEEKITPQKFAEITDITIGKNGLAGLVRDVASRKPNGKPITWDAAEDYVRRNCADVITTKEKRGSIVEVKEVEQLEKGSL